MTQTADTARQRQALGRRAGLMGIGLNLLLFLGKVTVGLLSGSVAAVADALNSLSDAASSAATLAGFYLAGRPADAKHPYGHARAEYLAALAVAGGILLVGVELARASVGKILHPEPVTVGPALTAVLALSALAKAALARYLKRLGRRIDSEALRCAGDDSRNDALATTAVLAGSLLGAALHWPLDGALGLLVAVFILVSGLKAARETVDLLLGRQADPEFLKKLTDLASSYPQVLGLHDLLVHDYGPGQCYASVHVEMDAQVPAMACHEVLDQIERAAQERLGVRLLVHFDPVDRADAQRARLLALVEGAARQAVPGATVHDLRLHDGEDRPLLTADLALPDPTETACRAAQTAVCAALAQEGLCCQVRLTFDVKAEGR